MGRRRRGATPGAQRRDAVMQPPQSACEGAESRRTPRPDLELREYFDASGFCDSLRTLNLPRRDAAFSLRVADIKAGSSEIRN